MMKRMSLLLELLIARPPRVPFSPAFPVLWSPGYFGGIFT
jgi:hypothetical protein